MCAVISLLTATLFVLAARQGFVRAEDSCYYPDGSVAEKDIPCGSSSSGSACCPQGWECLDTGICSMSTLDYITRYTCTDQSWDSSACPQYCLGGSPNGTDTGNVALLECSDNQYCCNGDRSGNCCNDKAVSLFAIGPDSIASSVVSSPATVVPATVPSSEPTSTSRAEPSTAEEKPTSTRNNPSTSSSKATSRSAGAPGTTIITSVVANPTDGAASTVYLTRTAASSAQTSTTQGSASSSSSNKSVVIGCAVGIPVSAAVFTIIAILLFRRRRRQKKSRCNNLLPPLPTIHEENEKGPRVSELDGFPRATGGSIAPYCSSAISEHYSGKGSRGHTRAASEVDGTPIPARENPPAELESPRNSKAPPVELDATDARSVGGYFRIPPTVGETGESPDPGRGYAVGGVAPPGGLRIVNAAEGELDSEVEGDAEGRASAAGQSRGSNVRIESPPSVYQSPRTWRHSRASLPSGVSDGTASGGIGSPVSSLHSHGWGR